MSVLNYNARRRLVNALIRETRARYREHEVAQPKKGQIEMPPLSPIAGEQYTRYWMSRLVKQCYRNSPEVLADWDVKLKADSEFGKIFSQVSEYNAQKHQQGKLLGADKIVEESVDQDTTNFVKNISNYSPTEQAIFAFDRRCRDNCIMFDDSLLSEEAYEKYRKLVDNEELIREYKALRSGGTPNLELTRKLVEEVDGEEEAQQKEREAKVGTDGEGEEGEEQSVIAQKMGAEAKGEEGDIPNPVPYDDREGVIKPLPIQKITPSTENTNGYLARIEEHTNIKLGKKIRNLLKTWSQVRWRGGKPKGKINKKSLASITAGNDRIFRQKEQKDILDVSVGLLVDSSGSMGGNKYTHAAASAILLSECLSSLHIPHAVWGFTEEEDCVIYEHKTFNSPISKQQLSASFASSDVSLGNNDDADSVLFAYSQLRQQKTKRKLLIVLSDGQPCGQVVGGRAYLKQVVREIEKEKKVEIYGVGIQSNAVREFYSDYKVLDDVRCLETAILTLIKDKLIV